ncbi:MAG: ATP-binding protein [Bacteroidetes bacterium]|nr:MAG: ATP-binding protein [Bacteroidota bacterium]
MKTIFKNIIKENQDFEVSNILSRNISNSIPLDINIIVSLIGARRSGKTYILYDLINKIKKRGVSKDKIVFINFEDERINVQQKDLDLIIQAYQEIYTNNDLSEVYFFFDEIQNVKGWEKFVRRIFDTKSRKIFITGSNSKLLSTEIATELRGRTVSYSVFPYSYNEFLLTQKAPFDLNTQAKRSLILNLTEKYMYDGGFPELINFDTRSRYKILQQYFNVMIYRDIVERYKISNPEVLKFFIKKLFASVTSPFSINKIYNDLKSMGYKISNKYLYEYADYCKSVFITQEISRFNFSEIKQIKSDKKAYAIDTGLLSAIDFKVSKNNGKLFENMTVMEFLKLEKEVFYFKDKYECDLIVKDKEELNAVQISYNLSDSETKERELRGLKNACNYLKIDKGTIITFDEEAVMNYKGIEVQILPFYKFFGNFK